MSRRKVYPAFGDWVFDARGSLVEPIEHSLGDLVRDAIEALPAAQRSLLQRRFYERLTYEEIAEEMGYDDARNHRQHAHYYVSAALSMLRKEIERQADSKEARAFLDRMEESL